MKNRLLVSGLVIAINLAFASESFARPQYVAAFGASGCTDCHVNITGGAPYKPALLTAWGQGTAAVQAYINSLKVTNTNTAPVLAPVNTQWDVTVGEVPLLIPYQVTDKQGDALALHATTVVPTGITVAAPRIDPVTHLQFIDLKWTPTALQANKNYPISIYAQEKATTGLLKSNTVATSVTVWPARTTPTKNVRQFVVQKATWAANKLTLIGLVQFKPTVTAAQRTASLSTLKMTTRSNTNVPVSLPAALTPTAAGAWTRTITLTGTQVPCLIKSMYEGLNSSRAVTGAPATCVK